MSAIIIGVDPGFASFGVATFILKDGQLELLNLSVIRTTKSVKKSRTLASDDNFRRAKELCMAFDQIIQHYSPVAVCAESMSFPRSSSVAAKMAMSWGVLAAFCYENDMPLVQSSPQAIKKKLCGASNASKEDVQLAVNKLCPDAIGLAGKTIASMHEHIYDAAAAVLSCADSEVILAIRKQAA